MGIKAAVFPNEGYSWKDITGAKVNVSNSWRKATVGYVKSQGEWKTIFVSDLSTVVGFSEIHTKDDVTFKWNAAIDVEKYELWYSIKGWNDATYIDYVKETEINSSVTTSTKKIILTQNSKIVTGLLTSFLTDLKPGNIIYTNVGVNRTPVGVVDVVNSNTQVTLKQVWTGTTSTPLGDDYIYQVHNTYTYNTEREKFYNFYLIPVNVDATKGDQSNIINLKTAVGPPPPITNFNFFVQDGKRGTFTLQWDLSDRYLSSSYKYYNDDGTGNAPTFKTLFSSLDGKYPTSVAGIQTYQIQIEAFNEVGESSGLSDILEYTYQPFTFYTMLTPSITASIANPTTNWNTVTVTWRNNPSQVDYYEFYVDGVLVKYLQSESYATNVSTTYAGPAQNTSYDIFVRAVARQDLGDIKFTNETEDSNQVSFTTGQPRKTSSSTKSGSNTVNALSRATTIRVDLYSRFRRGSASWSSWRRQNTFSAYDTSGRVGEFDNFSPPGYPDVVFTEVNFQLYRRTRTVVRARPLTYSAWSGWSRIVNSNSTNTSGRNDQVTDYSPSGYPNTTLAQYYSVTTYVTTRTEYYTNSKYTTFFDFSASAIKVNAGQTQNTTTLSVTSNAGRSVSVDVGHGGIEYFSFTDTGSISRTSDSIYTKLIDASSKVILNSTAATQTYSSGSVRVTYTFTEVTVTQTFSRATVP
jgi:hypothetical protein